MATSSAWEREPELVDETAFTPWAEQGWHSWNNMSPEREFCEFAAALVALHGPAVVIETGTGQGFTTRRVRERLAGGQRLVCFESDPEWRDALASLPFFADGVCTVAPDKSPSEEDFAAADLAVLDSRARRRREEVATWWRSARRGTLLLVHDTGNGHRPNTPHARLRALIEELGIPGAFLQNPRGAFVGAKP